MKVNAATRATARALKAVATNAGAAGDVADDFHDCCPDVYGNRAFSACRKLPHNR